MPIVTTTPESGYSAPGKKDLPHGVILGKSEKYYLLVCKLLHRKKPCNPHQLPLHQQVLENGRIRVLNLDQPTDIEPLTCAGCPLTRP